MILLIAAILAAMCGAVSGNRAAFPLLLGVAVGVVLRFFNTPFNPLGWCIMDLLIVLGIVFLWGYGIEYQHMPKPKWRDLAILALFPPMWFLYVVQPSGWVPVVELIVSAQLFLTFPIVRLRAWMRNKLAGRAGKSDSTGTLLVWLGVSHG